LNSTQIESYNYSAILKFMPLNRRTLTKELLFEFSHGDESIQYSIWLSDSSAPINCVVFLGTVQIGKLPAWIARDCPPGVAIIQGAPHWKAKTDASDLYEFMHHFTESALANVLNMHRAARISIITDSQATPKALEILSKGNYIGTVASLVLVQPLSLNPKAFGVNGIETLKARVKSNLRHQLSFIPIDRRLIYNHRQILRVIDYDNAAADAQYALGLATDSIEPLKKLRAARIPITIVCGEKDELFPPHEIEEHLQENNLDISVLVVKNTPHSPLPTKQGMRLFRQALEIHHE